MRKMKDIQTGTTINVVEHIIVRNFWEYYITDKHFTDDIVQALVIGAETEIGDISLNEISPYIISRTKKLDVFAAPGWEWE